MMTTRRRATRRGILAALPALALIAAAGCAHSGTTGRSALGAVTNSPSISSAPSGAPTAAATATAATTRPPTRPPTKAPPTAAHTWPTPEDCVSYHPGAVTVSAQSGTYTVLDGSTVVMRLHGQTDDVGKQGLALAQRYSKHCYLGRTNNRQDKGDFIFDYWRDPSGAMPPIPDEENLCSPYDKHNLTVEDMGGGEGWRVKDHDHVLHVFDNGSDARNGELVLSKYTQVCQIGDIDSNDDDLGSVSFTD